MSSLERKTVFLYPKGDELENQSYKITSHLIKRIRKIAFISNRTIKEILYGGSFSHIKCKPIVEMKCIGQHTEKMLDCSNVRICIAKYNGIDYRNNYNQIITSRKENKNNISHLVALYISNTKQKPKFSSDENDDFDAIIETDLDHLESILIAIMLDISLYHYFQLDNDIEFRKRFNSIKFQYIISHFEKENLEKTYGIVGANEKTIYLPFSMENVNALQKITKRTHRNDIIKELIVKYSVFLIESFSKKVVLDNRWYILNSSEINHDKYYTYLEKFAEGLRVSKVAIKSCILYFLAFNNSTGKSIAFNIEYNKDNLEISEWLNILSSDFSEFKLFRITTEV